MKKELTVECLKCCGNCEQYGTITLFSGIAEGCFKKELPVAVEDICDKWRFRDLNDFRINWSEHNE